MRKAYSGLIAPVPVVELAALAGEREVVAGTGSFNAIIDDEPGSSIEWALDIATKLASQHAGDVHAFDSDGDESRWLVTFRNGERIYDDEGLPPTDALGVPIDVP
jgi:hypothetical protein